MQQVQKSTISIRPAQVADLPEMQSLFADTITTICIHDYTLAQTRAWASSIKNTSRWIEKIQQQYFLIAHINGVMVGYASLDGSNYLDFLYVHKNYQRKGIAAKLVGEIEREAFHRGAKILEADVSITARPFFEKNGFKVVTEQQQKIADLMLVNFKMKKVLVILK